MICEECVTKVKANLVKIGIRFDSVELGEINTRKDITLLQIKRLQTIY
jgi:hypothetical protein